MGGKYILRCQKGEWQILKIGLSIGGIGYSCGGVDSSYLLHVTNISSRRLGGNPGQIGWTYAALQEVGLRGGIPLC